MTQAVKTEAVPATQAPSRRAGLRRALRIGGWTLLALVAIILPFPADDYRTFQFTEVAIFAVIVLGLNVLTGYSGQISLGHGAFVLLGGYVTAMLTTGQFGGVHVHPLLAVPLGGLAAAVLGVLIGIPALRLSGPYLAVVTLGLTIALPIILKSTYLDDYTQGAHGILVTKPTPPSGFLANQLFPAEWQYFIVLLPCVLLMILAWNVLRGRNGRAFVALRDSEPGAQMAGVNIARYKLMAFGISAFYAGIGGALLVLLLGFISPDTFTLLDSINYLTAVVIGGLGSMLGSIVGGFFLAFQTEINSRLAEIIPQGQDLRWAIYGALLILIMVFAPGGIAGLFRGSIPWHRLRRGARPAPASTAAEAPPRTSEAEQAGEPGA